MKHSYPEVTYRNGCALAAYYDLPRLPDDHSAKTARIDAGLRGDFASDRRPIGIEITSPSQFDLTALNRALQGLGQKPVSPVDLSPLVAA